MKPKKSKLYNSNFLFDFVFEQTKLIAKEFYFTILAEWDPIIPAFNEKVEISHVGWDHLHKKIRSKFDNLARYFALPKIIPLLKDKGIKPKHEKGRKHLYSIMWRGEVKEKQKKRSCLSHVKRTRGVITPQLQSLFTTFLKHCQPLDLKHFVKENQNIV